MHRQDPIGLDEADGERQRDDEGNDEHELADDAGQEHQRQEGRHRRQHRGGDRREYLAQRRQTRFEGCQAALHLVVDRLDDDHRIVDEHAERDHHTEQHRDVERVAQAAEHGESTGQRERDAQCHQHGDARAEEDPAHRQHHEQPDQGVGLHDADRFARLRRLVIEQLQFEALAGELRVLLGDEAVDARDELQRVGAAFLGDRQHHRRLARITRQRTGFGARARDFRDAR